MGSVESVISVILLYILVIWALYISFAGYPSFEQLNYSMLLIVLVKDPQICKEITEFFNVSLALGYCSLARYHNF